MPQAKTILLVDDNAVQAAIRQVILRRAGYFVITALNPARALEQLRRHDFPSEIELVVTDHIMPGMIGTEFVQQIRLTHPALPVLVISGLDQAADEYVGLNVEFRLKPLPPEELLSCVHDLISDAATVPVTIPTPAPSAR
jgi:DNA-binding NtrC family response regulator